MPYVVLVDDNFHYQDATERYRYGDFADFEVAIGECCGIVEDYLASAWKPGMSAEALWDSYTSFGPDPFIRCIDVPAVSFSAWDYAKFKCEELRGGQVPMFFERRG